MNARYFINLFEAPHEFARLHDLSPEYAREIQGRVRQYIQSLQGRALGNADIQKLSRILTLQPQDVQTLVKQITTQRQDTPADRAMVPT